MLSIARHLDWHDIAQEIRLERGVHKGSFLVLEGETDIKRFHPFLDEIECSTVNAWGRTKALEVAQALCDEGFLGVVACVDADFDRILQRLTAHEAVIFSAAHDLDMDWAVPANVTRYLAEVADRSKLEAWGEAREVRIKILEGLKPISVARFLNSQGIVRCKLNHVDCADCFTDFKVDVDSYVEIVFRDRPSTPQIKKRLKELIAGALARQYDLDQITNGHDFCCALGASLRQSIGDRKNPQAWGKEVETHFRLLFSDIDFRQSHVFREIRMWESDNRPFMVLDPRFAH